MEHHVPVLLKETVELLINNKSGNYFDGTAGFGGHIKGVLNQLENAASVIATDVDLKAYEHCKAEFSNDKRVKLFNANFTQIDFVSKVSAIDSYDGIFLDLGVSSYQFDDKEAGFTYREESELDFRMDKNIKQKASDLLNSLSRDEIADIIYYYGEEGRSRVIADAIIKFRESQKILTTTQLREVIANVVPAKHQIKILSRVFQALRIFVNDELDSLKKFLDDSVKLLNIGGRIVIISYHSLEDRIVKNFFKEESTDYYYPSKLDLYPTSKEKRLRIITKKPVVASEDEVKNNRRARSAKLRVAERI